MVGYPLPSRGITEVEQQLAAVAAEDPLGMRLRQPRIGLNPLGLEPDDEFHPVGVNIVGDFLETLGVAHGIGSQVPVSHQPPPQGYQPASIHQ